MKLNWVGVIRSASWSSVSGQEQLDLSAAVTGGFRFLVRLAFLSSNPRGQFFFQLILWTKFKMAWWNQIDSFFSRSLSWLFWVSKSVSVSIPIAQTAPSLWQQSEFLCLSLSLSSGLSLSLPLCSTCACCLSVSVCPWSYSRWEGRRSPPLLPLSAEGPSAAV